MSGPRKTRLIDCNPRWGSDSHPADRWITFDCPEGHAGCTHTIPFSPALDGTPIAWVNQASWERMGGDTFETLTLTPSIRRIPRYETREAAIADGRIPEYVTEAMLCALHIEIVHGQIVFCGDSR